MSKGHVAYLNGVNYMAAIHLVAGADPKTARVVAGGGPADFVTPSLVTFSAPDGTELHGSCSKLRAMGTTPAAV